MNSEEKIEAARRRAETAQARLLNLIAAECPGPHAFVQHRDRLAPWCEECRRTPDGSVIEARP